MVDVFEYDDFQKIREEGDEFRIVVPADVMDQQELYKVLQAAGVLPDYFGNNWDALLDSLRDLSWINERKIILAHSDIPMIENHQECQIYLSIIKTALLDWKLDNSSNNTSLPPEGVYVDHEFRVIFPKNTKHIVLNILHSADNLSKHGI